MLRNPNTTNASTSIHNGFSARLMSGRGMSIIRLAGSVGIEHGEAFEAALMAMAHRIDSVALIDLTDLRFINVIGLGVIVRLGNALQARGGRLALHGAAPNICQLIRTLRLHEVFPPLSLEPADTAHAEQPEYPAHAHDNCHELAICA